MVQILREQAQKESISTLLQDGIVKVSELLPLNCRF